MSLNGFIDSFWSFVFAGAPDVGSSQYELAVHRRTNFSNGTGAGQATHAFADSRSLNASSSESLDLAGGLTGEIGGTLTFTAIKAIRVYAAPTNGGNIVIGGAASNTFTGPFADATDKIALPAGGVFEVRNPSAAGWAVTAGTGDLLKIENTDGAAAASYTIEIIGEA